MFGRRRSPKSLAVIVLVMATLLGACSSSSSSSSSGERNAFGLFDFAQSFASANDPSQNINVDDYCRDISSVTSNGTITCFLLDNQTTKFTGPNQTDSRFELTVPRCLQGVNSNSELGCSDAGGYYGSVYYPDGGSRSCGASCPGRLTPNPFTGLAGMKFTAGWQWFQGATNRLYVNSKQAPMDTSQIGASPFFDNPYSKDNQASCDQGEYIACEIIDSSWQRDGSIQRPKYRFTTWPMVVEVVNTNKTAYLRQSVQVRTSNMLLDPAATSTPLSAVPGDFILSPGETGYFGGYRSTSKDGTVTFTTTFAVVGRTGGNTTPKVDSNGNDVLDPSGNPVMVPVPGFGSTFTISVVVPGRDVDPKGVSASSCKAVNASSAITYNCVAPTISGEQTSTMTAVVQIKDF